MSDTYAERLDELSTRVADACEAAGQDLSEGMNVFYSAYNTDENGDPIDNLDEVAAKGTFRLFAAHDDFWGEGEDYLSEEEVTDPTWLQVAVHANASIPITGDYHHIFLENVEVDGNRLILWFGS